MSDELDENDPDAKALKPQVSRKVMIAAVASGALFGLGLALASLVFESHMPRFGLEAQPDAGPSEIPDTVELDAGAPAGDGAESPWLE